MDILVKELLSRIHFSIYSFCMKIFSIKTILSLVSKATEEVLIKLKYMESRYSVCIFAFISTIQSADEGVIERAMSIE